MTRPSGQYDLPSPSLVAICREGRSYPSAAPYGPDEAYPELGPLASDAGGAPNEAYRAVRDALRLLGCDASGFDRPEWNPFGAWMRPGERVLVKPNWVMHRHPDEDRLGIEAARDCLVTHPGVLRAVLDYVQLALRGEGRIVLADAPLQGCDFDELLRRSHIPELVDHYARMRRAGTGQFPPVPVEVHDLRLEVAVERGALAGVGVTLRKELRDETQAHSIVNLDGWSSLEPIAARSRAFRVTGYDPEAMGRTHRPGHHAYCVSRHVLEADAIVNVPKLKTHKKGGVTVALKNLVGINGHKSFLPHHRQGSIADGGDEYLAEDRLKLWTSRLYDTLNRRDASPHVQRMASLAASALAALGRLVREEGIESGCWYGNDTIWRTCLDLNRIVLYADVAGAFRGADPEAAPQRRVLHLVDGIHGGDGDGPLAPHPRPSGLVLAGTSAAFVDLAAARVMGLAWLQIPLVREAFGPFRGAPLASSGPDSLEIASNVAAWHGVRGASPLSETLDYQPAPGWEGVLDPHGGDHRVPLRAAVRRPGLLWHRASRGVAVP